MSNSLLSPFDPCLSAVPVFGLGKFLVLGLAFILLPSSKFLTPSGSSLVVGSLLNFMKLSFLSLFGKKAPYGILVSLFSFVLVSNFLGLIPYSFSPTSHMSVNLPLGLILWASGVMYSIVHQGYTWAHHFVPQGSPLVLSPFLSVVELISNFIRPISLSVRLMSNMIAGHMILGLMWGITWQSSSLFFSVSVLSGMFLMFELAVSIIQSFVFATLMSLYWAEADSHE